MDENNLIKMDSDALSMLSFYSHLVANKNESIDFVMGKSEEVIYNVAIKYLSEVGFTDARSTITPETYQQALKLGLIENKNGVVTSRFTNISSFLTHSIDLLNPRESYQDLSDDVNDIFKDAQEMIKPDHFETSYKRKKIVPFTGLNGDGKYLNNLLSGNTAIDFGDPLFEEIYTQPTEGYKN